MKSELLSSSYFEKLAQIDKDTGCWLWKPRNGVESYGQIRVDGKPCLAHRASWTAKNGPIPDGLFVCHKCDRPRCVNPDHLFLGTNQDNVADCVSKGRSSGQKTNYAFTRLKRMRKLSNSQVIDIFQSKASLAELSEKYGVSKASISMIRNKKRKQIVTNN